MSQLSPTLERRWTRENRLSRSYGRPGAERTEVATPGPWWDEPDKVQWVDEETDYDCLLNRNHFGAWCGYVGLPPGHPLHGVGYSQCIKPEAHERDEDWVHCYEHSPDALVEVHGGLTFADSCNEEAPEDAGVCHVPFPGRPGNVWWLGFDCGHAFDLSPLLSLDIQVAGLATGAGLPAFMDNEVYRDMAYARQETTALARQLKAMETLKVAAVRAEPPALEG